MGRNGCQNKRGIWMNKEKRTCENCQGSFDSDKCSGYALCRPDNDFMFFKLKKRKKIKGLNNMSKNNNEIIQDIIQSAFDDGLKKGTKENPIWINCLIQPYQMWQVGFFNERERDFPEFMYKACDLLTAVKGAKKILDEQLNGEKIKANERFNMV
jgi:hypothetical protein